MDGVHREQRQTDLRHLLHLQRTQRSLLGHQKWTTKEGKKVTRPVLQTLKVKPAVFSVVMPSQVEPDFEGDLILGCFLVKILRVIII